MELYAFSNLEEQVKKSFKVDPDKVESTFEFKRIKQELRQKDIKHKVAFERAGEQGIYYNEDGILYKGFLYIQSYNPKLAAVRGFNTLPVFHISKCKTISDQIKKDNYNGHYIFENAIVFMKDVDGVEKDLRLCGNCRRETGLPSMHTTEYYNNFIKNDKVSGNLKAKDLPKEYETNLWGYTPDWYEKSQEYRQKKKFTCESCGIRLDGANGWYLDTHHISGRKTNNTTHNLKCLCVLCHANVDEVHQRNFSTGRNRQRLEEFVQRFRKELSRLGNQYI